MRSTSTDIIVIGAGAAGMRAAQVLGEAGKNVIILEARPRIGGRIYTVTPAGFSSRVELGAEFIHGDLPHTLGLIGEASLNTHIMNGQAWNIEKGRATKSSMMDLDWETLWKKVKALKKDLTLDQFIDQHLAEEKYASLVSSLKKFVEGYDAADPKRVSMFALREEWSEDEDSPQYRIQEGYSQMVEWLREKCGASGVTILLERVVDRIRWDGDNVTVGVGESHFTGKCVLVTIPVGLLADGVIRFTPAISDHISAAKNIGIGGVIKFLAEFKSPFWEDDPSRTRYLPEAGFIFSDASIPTWWTQLPDKRPLLTGWLSGPKAFNTKDSQQLQNDAIQSLCYLFRCSEEFLQENLNGLEVVNWITEPYSRGAYSYATPETQDAKQILNTPIADRIYFAGEALYEGKEMGTVEAALSSGEIAAKKIINMLK